MHGVKLCMILYLVAGGCLWSLSSPWAGGVPGGRIAYSHSQNIRERLWFSGEIASCWGGSISIFLGIC